MIIFDEIRNSEAVSLPDCIAWHNGRDSIRYWRVAMRKMILLLVLLMLTSGCAASRRDTNNTTVVEPSTDNYNLETDAEDGGDENYIGTQETRMIPDDEWEAWLAEQHKINIEHIIRGPYTPADSDIDFETIERFVFFTQSWHYGDILVIDKIYGNVYHDPNFHTAFLKHIEYSSEFRDEDLERLITALEKSGVRDWDVSYQGEDDINLEHSGWGWGVRILFSDGTMMRRGGGGTGGIMTPPEAQFSILTDFIESMGAEIIERYNAETDSGN